MSDLNTEEKILEAAREVFIAKGLDGARMQDIADKAGINKALLHYYFRSKEMLFQKIFLEKGRELVQVLEQVVGTNLSVREILAMLIDLESDKLDQEPLMPLFVISEINRNPAKLLQVPEIQACRQCLKKLALRIELEKQQGKIRKELQFQDVIMDVMSLMHFPRIGKNLFVEMLYDRDKVDFAKEVTRRREHIKFVILRSLEP